MKPVPFLPALIGFLLTLPFLFSFGALVGLFEPPRTYWADPYSILNAYGAIYLAMLGGVYWGFSAKKLNIVDAAIALLPPFAALGAALTPTPVLPFGIAIAGMLVIDILFVARGLAPKWWLSLRVYMSIVAVGALVYAYYA